ncbi:hypothetical protein ACFSKN_04760 [Mariniflexile gromovii]|uniref:CRISPR type III-B/RAMP module-associated protein Cmr5 n=1 Tax=Mariniflexile gromovii TaxID=362523 RepID=A0ABS4BXU7_9FLAO|nr:hypothetical protein [Mariniflexile gromovii]MBP0904841.1 hypothetical protein [Mariniflexile gromovii]
MTKNNQTYNDVIKTEIEAIISDIIKVYNDSGKRTLGEFENGLEAVYGDNKATLLGYVYLDGRQAGKQPPVEAIKKWIEQKGIKPLSDKMSVSGLAWAIAKKIAKSGTNKENHLKIYEEVITPERINEIINKVSVFNANQFVNEIEASLEILAKNK